MRNLGRRVSLFFRMRDSLRDRDRVLQRFREWQELQQRLPPPAPILKTLLLIRMDDIGDYLLFRNQLASYKKSARWADHTVTLLANDAWKALFAQLDATTVDEVIWVNKGRYLYNNGYRASVWQQLREKGFETVIATSRTRPLLIDDLCVLAAAPHKAIGSFNTNVHVSWNQVSDALYVSLFKPSHPLLHEFPFNAEFTRWVCGNAYEGRRPLIKHQASLPIGDTYVLLFIGASTASRRWPARRWIQLVRLYRRHHAGQIFLAGHGAKELKMAQAIQKHTGAESLVGKVSLVEMLDWIAGARAVFTNDTMAAHIGVSLNRPTVIVANGINYMRFSDYSNAGVSNAATLYPDVVTQRRKRDGNGPYDYSETVSADIASIQAAAVIQEYERLIAGPASETDSRGTS
jgi:ADP-heptose:LPS heptosyltransferase